jgi:Anti-sigma factor NepR
MIYLRPRLNALAGRWLVIMEPRRINAFADVNLDDGLKLAIARDLKRVWSEVLEQPLPTELRRLIDRLEQATRGQSLGPE